MTFIDCLCSQMKLYTVIKFCLLRYSNCAKQVDAHIYLWKWNARIVISDVDGTITK